MSSKDRFDKKYAERMRNWSYGHALFDPLPTSILKPGCSGFFDDDGTWSPVVDISDPKSLDRYHLNPPSEEPDKTEPNDTAEWGPLTSKGVDGWEIDLSGGIDTMAETGIPAEANLQFKYSTKSDFGAVLVASAPIHLEGFDYKSDFVQWFKGNVEALMASSRGEDITKYGLFIVTQTYSTKKCRITAWTKPSVDAHFGFDVGVSGIGKFGPHVKWFEGKSDRGWRRYEAKKDDRIVVFAKGVLCKPRKIFSHIHISQKSTHYLRKGGPDDNTEVEVHFIPATKTEDFQEEEPLKEDDQKAGYEVTFESVGWDEEE